MNIPILPEITEAEALTYGLIDLDVPSYETEFNLWLEGLNCEAWLDELEETAAYRSLVASYRLN